MSSLLSPCPHSYSRSQSDEFKLPIIKVEDLYIGNTLCWINNNKIKEVDILPYYYQKLNVPTTLFIYSIGSLYKSSQTVFYLQDDGNDDDDNYNTLFPYIIYYIDPFYSIYRLPSLST